MHIVNNLSLTINQRAGKCLLAQRHKRRNNKRLYAKAGYHLQKYGTALKDKYSEYIIKLLFLILREREVFEITYRGETGQTNENMSK